MALFTLITTGACNTGTLITDIMFAFCTVALFFRFAPKVRVIADYLLHSVSIFLLACLLDVALDAIGLSSYPGPSAFSLFIALAFYAALQQDLRVEDRLVRACTFASLFSVVVGITGVIQPAFPAIADLSFGDAIPSTFSYICMVGSVVFVRCFSIEKFNFIPRGSVVLAVVIDVLGVVASQVFQQLFDHYSIFDYVMQASDEEMLFIQNLSGSALLIDSIFLVLMASVYYLFYSLAKEHDERADMLVTKKSEADNESVVAVTKTMYEQLREVRHEIRNHDAYLVALLDEGDYDKLREVLMSQVGERAEVIRRVSTGNLTVDAVVNAKIALAHADGIHVETMLAAPEKLPFDDDDVFRLIANLMDNAIEGVKTAGVEDATITLQLQPKGGYWFITVRNPCDPAKVNRGRDGRLKTSKPDGDVHGYGTRVVSRIAEKYQGTAHFSVEGSTFVASVMLVGEEAGAADLKEAA